MKNLNDILNGIKIVDIKGDSNITIKGISLDSRKIEKDFLFIAIEGTSSDGHNYINNAIENGATAIVHSNEVEFIKNVTYIKTSNNIENASLLSSNFYNNPSKKLKIIGVTGTNGKTTIATTLYNLFTKLGFRTGLISTVVNKIGDKDIPTKLTTPDAIELNKLFAEMVSEKCEYCFMEVSSHAVVQGRVSNIDFDGGIFTNLSHDHLDYHKTFKSYINAKKLFFDKLKKDAFVLTNIDDKNGRFVVQNTNHSHTYALKTLADFKAKIIERHFDATLVKFDNHEIWLQFVGSFNVYNLLAVYGTANLLLPNNEAEILQAISTLKPVAGRFDVVKGNGIFAIVDYAHTPDALENTLKELKDIKRENQKLTTVVGAGGDRDNSKRPIMAKVASQYSDFLILTSDNPRTENPEKILDDMEKGLDENAEYLRIADRRQAIKTAVKLSKNDDIIFIAGKGHETYQEINGVRHHFDDKEEIKNQLTINN